jgi:hypothetical protein
MSLAQVRTGLVRRLRDRRSEIEEVIFARARAVSDHVGGGDAEYLAGLRATVAAVVGYGLTGIEHGEEWSGPIPSVAVAQAHLAARNGVGLETVWLRYVAGQRHLERFVMAEADHFPSQALRQVVDTQWSLLERLMDTISAEYNREVERVASSFEQRRGQRLQKLLAGEPIDLGEFDYEFDDAWHLAVIATGARAREAVRGLATACERQLLPISRGERTMWAWLGGGTRLSVADVNFRVPAMGDPGTLLAVGEPGKGINGWRLTHYQAQAALLVALHGRQGITRYAEDMLLAAALQNDTLARSLEAMYLLPLASQRDGGAAWRATLRAYFDAQGNAATAASSMGVGRHTVERRLRSIEETLGRLLHTCQSELEVALSLHELWAAPDPHSPSLIQSPAGRRDARTNDALMGQSGTFE